MLLVQDKGTNEHGQGAEKTHQTQKARLTRLLLPMFRSFSKAQPVGTKLSYARGEHKNKMGTIHLVKSQGKERERGARFVSVSSKAVRNTRTPTKQRHVADEPSYDGATLFSHAKRRQAR